MSNDDIRAGELQQPAQGPHRQIDAAAGGQDLPPLISQYIRDEKIVIKLQQRLVLVAAPVSGNPLDEIRLDTERELGDTEHLVKGIVGSDRTHWNAAAAVLLSGLILHALHRCKFDGTKASLGAIYKLLCEPNRRLREVGVEMACSACDLGPDTRRAIAGVARDLITWSEEELGSVVATARAHLSLYAPDAGACPARV